MYIGRFVVLGRTPQGRPFLGYRVSSRSFPNRRIVTKGDSAVVLPTPDAPPTDNPYVTYNCLRRAGSTVVVANGSHVDPAIEKVSLGYPLRDALALTLLAMDYEHDQYNTPRIAAGLDLGSGVGWLGLAADDAISVQRLAPEPGQALLIATYERRSPTPIALGGETAEELADALFACEYEHPVAALAAVADGAALALAVRNAR